MDTNELKSKLTAFGANVRDSAGKLTKSAAETSRKAGERIRIQNRLHKAENQLQEAQLVLGRRYEELYGNRNDPDLAQYIADIANARAQIAAAHAELTSLDQAFVCQKCHQFVTENQKFCPHCGTELFHRDPIVDTDYQEL